MQDTCARDKRKEHSLVQLKNNAIDTGSEKDKSKINIIKHAKDTQFRMHKTSTSIIIVNVNHADGPNISRGFSYREYSIN